MNTFNESQIKEISTAFRLLCSEWYIEKTAEGVDLYINHMNIELGKIVSTEYINTFNDTPSAMMHALKDGFEDGQHTWNLSVETT